MKGGYRSQEMLTKYPLTTQQKVFTTLKGNVLNVVDVVVKIMLGQKISHSAAKLQQKGNSLALVSAIELNPLIDWATDSTQFLTKVISRI